MIISHSRRFTFIHIHKAGGTSVELGLDAHLAWNDLILGGSELGQSINSAYRTRFGLSKHSSVADVLKICGPPYIDSYYLFAFVRHPLNRICSLYNFVGSLIRALKSRDHVRQANTEMSANIGSVLKWPSSRVFLASENFSEFIRNESLVLDTAFHPQVTRLTCPASGKIKGDVFRLEDASRAIPAIAERIGVDFGRPHENKSETKLIDPGAVSIEDQRYLQKRFAVDYDAFGYGRQALE